jgi:hypothetical protein
MSELVTARLAVLELVLDGGSQRDRAQSTTIKWGIDDG